MSNTMQLAPPPMSLDKPLMQSGKYQLFNTGEPKKLKLRVERTDEAAFWFEVADCPVYITARIFDADTGARGCLLEFTHVNTGEDKTEVIWDAELSSASTAPVLEKLARQGLTIFKEVLAKNVTTRSVFLKWVMNARPETTISIHSKSGWSEDGEHYVLASEVFPPENQISVLENEQSFLSKVKPDLEKWNDLLPHINEQPMWMFSAQLAFAGPLLLKVNIPQSSLGGFVFHGGSGTGKTYCNMIGQAVFGSESIQFNATRTGLADVALAHNDRTLFLDELHQAGPMGRSESSGSAQIGQVIYDLANGTGRIRRIDAKKLEKPKHWKVVWLGTGEISSADYIRPAFGESKEGQRIRAADIPADHPLIHVNLGTKKGREICGAIQDLAPKCGGAAGRKFVQWLSNLSPDNLKTMRKEFDEIYETHFEPLAMTGTQTRLAERCALVAYAGRLAAELELLKFNHIGGWLEAPLNVFRVWQEEVGGEALNDVQRCAIHLVSWADSVRGEQLIPLTSLPVSIDDNKKTMKMAYSTPHNASFRKFAGFVEDNDSEDRDCIYIIPGVFRELCGAFGGAPSVCRKLKEENVLITNSGSNSNQFQLNEVREFETLIKRVNHPDEHLAKLGKIVWRHRSKLYKLDLDALETFATKKKEGKNG